ncbi:MAG: hypothetical protein AB1689_13555 [Thermodesulfobacteriota bacterium]
MPVSQADRDYFARIGEHKRRSHAEACAEHRALSLAERLERSWRLHERFPDAPDAKPEADPRRFYDRARELGLYTP